MDTDEPERVLKAPTVYTPPVPKQVAPAAPCTLQARARARAYRVPNQRVRALSPQEAILDVIEAPPWEGPSSLQAPKPKAVVEVRACVACSVSARARARARARVRVRVRVRHGVHMRVCWVNLKVNASKGARE